MTIRELFYTNDYPDKEYDVEDLPKTAKDRLVEIQHDDETKLAALRLTGAGRLWGFMREEVFHVLWWDPRHEVWPSVLKHT